MVPADLVVEHADVPGKPVVLLTAGFPHSLTPPVEEVVVEGVHPRVGAQDVDAGDTETT